MKKAHQLKELTVGEVYITAITYDLALYAKAVQLVDAPSLPLGGCGMTLILGATLTVRLLLTCNTQFIVSGLARPSTSKYWDFIHGRLHVSQSLKQQQWDTGF